MRKLNGGDIMFSKFHTGLGIRALLVPLLAVTLSQCVRYEIEDQSLQFNQAVGTVANRLLLLNAVRAAKGYPTQFSKLATYTGQGRISGKIGAKFPFTLNHIGTGTLARAVQTGNVDPSLSFNSGVQSMQFVDLNTEEAQKLLHKTLTATALKYYLEQGWENRLVNTILFESITVINRLATPIFRKYMKYCKEKKKNKRKEKIRIKKCYPHKKLSNLSRNSKKCDPHEILKNNTYTVRRVTYVDFTNDPRNVCQFYAFQFILEAFGVSSGFIDSNPKKKKVKQKKVQKKPVIRSDRFAIDVNLTVPKKKAVATSGPAVTLAFANNRKLQNTLDDLKKKVDYKGVKIRPMEAVFRSPERMVRFLGDVISAQVLAKNGANLKIRIDDDIVNLFYVERGRGSRSAVAVTGPEGERFFIPIPDHGSPSRHRSLPALALVADFMNSAVSGASLPASNSVILSGN